MPDLSSCLPENGPCILFFSGGTALAPVAKELFHHTRNAVHVITTFDSGGSSAELRRVFDMPAVGDLRARIMALADSGVDGNPETVALLGYRLPVSDDAVALHRELRELASGRHALTAAIHGPMHEVILQHLEAFVRLMPSTMELSGASIGNLVLTAGYLSLDRQLEPVVTAFSRMVQARGVVVPVTNACAHLCVRLENGETILGQHRFTGKTATSITSPIRDLWLSASLTDAAPVAVAAPPRLCRVIRSADLICYPVGSFFSSVMANLLPEGVIEAIGAASCPKLFIPNLGTDPELFGLTVQEQVAFLLRRGPRMLDWLLVDEDVSRYPGGIPYAWLQEQGIGVRALPLVVEPPYLDAARVCAALAGVWTP